MSNRTCKVVGYLRVSTTDQADDGVSLASQEERIRAYCLVNDLELEAVFVDRGISGKRSDNRPQLQKAISQVCDIQGCLVVYSLSRLARSTRDTIDIAEQLDRSGADLVSISEKIDTTSAAGKMVFRMLAVMAEFERDLVSERTTVAMQHKRNQGERVGAVPYGYNLDSDGVTLVENEQEQRVLALIDELRSLGYSLRAIAKQLEERGITTKSGADKWCHTTVQRILTRVAA